MIIKAQTGTDRASTGHKPVRILFVCLGNICRSPAAQAVMQQLVDKKGLTDSFVIDSAGTYGGHAGWPPDGRMVRHASRRGIVMRHRARQMHGYDFADFDLVVGMDDSNVANIKRMAPTQADERKVLHMGKFIKANPHYDHVPDPYYEGAEGFELALDLLEDACQNLLDWILTQQLSQTKHTETAI